MNKKISWNEIKNDFAGQWVELVDCDWDWKDAHPRSARILNSSDNRKKLITKDSKDSVILYVSGGNTLIGAYKESFSQAAGF